MGSHAGFTNHSLRGLVAGPLGQDYSASQMTYDLRHLRLHGLLQRSPRTHPYALTADGVRVAVFYNKAHARLIRPLIASPDQPPAPLELRRALAHHRPSHHQLRRQRPPHRGMKPADTLQKPATELR